jgi:hypothetical protein
MLGKIYKNLFLYYQINRNNFSGRIDTEESFGLEPSFFYYKGRNLSRAYFGDVEFSFFDLKFTTMEKQKEPKNQCH